MSIFGRLFSLNLGGEPPLIKKDAFRQDNINKGLYAKLFHSSRISFVKKLNSDFENDVNNLSEHVLDFNRKIQLMHKFLTTKKMVHLDGIRDELKSIYRITEKEENLDRKEDKYVIKTLKHIRKILKIYLNFNPQFKTLKK